MEISKKHSEVSEDMKAVNENLEREIQQQSLSPEQTEQNAQTVDRIKASVGGKIVKSAQVIKDGVSFSGTPKYHLDKVKEHGQNARTLERKANDLESAIRRKKEPESRMSEVDKLRKDAAEEKQQEQRHKGLAQQALQKSHVEPSFRGSCRDLCLKAQVKTTNLA